MIIDHDTFYGMPTERQQAIREWLNDHRVPWCFVRTVRLFFGIAVVEGFRINEEGRRYIETRDDVTKTCTPAKWVMAFKMERPFP